MSAEPNFGGESLSLSALAQVHSICNDFETAFRAGAAPAIEEYIEKIGQDPQARSALFLGLLEAEFELRRARGERPSTGEYVARFPEYAAMISAAAADWSTRGDRPRSKGDTARNLLLGVLALQNSFISREALLAAFNSWLADRTRSLGSILVEQRHLTANRLAVLDGLVAEHALDHGGDPEMTLAAVRSPEDPFELLCSIKDADVEASLAAVRAHGSTPYGSDVPTGAWFGALRSSLGDGRFRVLRDHKEGGMGKVSVASDVELNRTVALKEIKPEYAGDQLIRSRFVVEAEITVRSNTRESCRCMRWATMATVVPSTRCG